MNKSACSPNDNNPKEATVSASSSSKNLPAYVATPIPVLASTRLCLELLVQGGAFDLRVITELIGRDPGAVLGLFLLIATEFPNPNARPERLEDCIASVQSNDVLRALGNPPSSRDEQMRFIAFAQHGFTIAQFARAVAASLGLCQELAHLVGLLHAIGTPPAALDRTGLEPAEEAALDIVLHYHLPPDLREAVTGLHRKDSRSIWMAVMHAAHDLAYENGEMALESCASIR